MNEFRRREDERHYDNYDRRYNDKGYDSHDDYEYEYHYDELDEIMYSEYDNYHECIHKKYYIGSYWYENHENIIHAKTVKISTFYHFTNDCISNYICLSCDLQFTPTIEIIQVIMNDDGTYKYIIKTFWIKIIQRKWKKIMQEHRMKM
jgi:hypothetical protein